MVSGRKINYYQTKMSSTVIYGVSVDSRSRNSDEPDNNYTVQLRRTLDRVKTIQLGSFQFQDARPAFANTPTIRYSEPIPNPAPAFVRFYEETIVQNKVTGEQTSSTRAVTMYVPPTLNPIVAMTGATHEVITALDHGMTFACNFFPEVGLRASIVCGDFPQDLQAFTTAKFPTDSDGPVLTADTLQAPGFYLNQKTFRFDPAYLGELTGGTSDANMPLRFLNGTLGSTYTSYVYCPPPTMSELFIMLNATTRFMNMREDVGGAVLNASNSTPIYITTAGTSTLSTGDQVVIADVTGNTAANGTWFITAFATNTFILDDSSGNGVFSGGGTWFSPQKLMNPVTYGFNESNGKVVVSSPDRVTESTTTRTTIRVRIDGTLLYSGNTPLDPPAEQFLPTIIERPVILPTGTFTGPEVAVNTTYRFNPGNFKVRDVTQRTLHYLLPSGVPAQLPMLYGNYTDAQLVDYINLYLSGVPAEIVASYNGLNASFTFTHARGLAFALDFASSSELVAQRFGFDRVVYSGASTYTSVRSAVYGVEVEPRTATYPFNNYTISADTSTQQYTFRVEQPTQFYVQAGVTVPSVGASWSPQIFDGEGYAHRFLAGELMIARRPLLSSTQYGNKRIIAASNTSPIIITTAAAHDLTTGDNITIDRVQGNTAANGTWVVTYISPTTFTLDGSDGNGAYIIFTGSWWTNTSWSATLGTWVATPVFQVVVGSSWDASGAPTLSLGPTASLMAAVPEDAAYTTRYPLATPALTDGLVLMQPFRRNVFMLHFRHPDGVPENFGFPPMAWPPSEKTMLASGEPVPMLTSFPTYDPSILGVPIASSYTSPNTWNLKPPDYILVALRVQCAAQDIHSHSYRNSSCFIFAKLLITSPYNTVSEQIHFTTLASLGRLKTFIIEFQNADGSLVDFNGRPHNYTLLFSVVGDRAILPCM